MSIPATAKKEVSCQILQKETVPVKCVTCSKEVSAELVPFGFGRVGICPKCGELAYNGK